MTRLRLALLPGLLALGAWVSVHGDAAGADAPPGVRLDGGWTLIAQHDDGRDHPDATASIDLFVEIPRARGAWTIYLEANTTPSDRALAAPEINADAGTALDGEERGRVQLSELKYAFDVGEGRRLAVGLLDPTAYLDATRIDNDENRQFLAAPFVNNPVIEFPDYTPGLAYARSPGGSMPEIRAVLAGSDGLGDQPDRSYSELAKLDAAGKGFFAAVETTWTGDGRVARLGGWIRGRDHPTLDGRSSGRKNLGLWAGARFDVAGGTVNLRLGLADRDVSTGDRFASVTYQLAGRRWTLGSAIGAIGASPEASGAEDQLHAEGYLSVVVGRKLYLTPSLQVVWNRGLDPAPATDRTTVFSLRLHRTF